MERELLPVDQTVEVAVDAVAVRAHESEEFGGGRVQLPLDWDALRIHELQVLLHVLTRRVHAEEDLGLDEVLLAKWFINVLPQGILLKARDEEVLDDGAWVGLHARCGLHLIIINFINI